MASKRRTTRRKTSGGRRTPSPVNQPSLLSLIERMAADIHVIGQRLEACERRDDEAQSSLFELQAAVEPMRMALSGAAPEEIARHVDYLGLVARVRRTVRDRVPRQARVLVVGRGDDSLLQLFGRTAGHFPQDSHGDFAGEYPVDGAEAVAAIASLVEAGWDHLVIPATSFWWLDHYSAFRMHLHRAWHAVHRDADTCMIFAHDPARPGPWNECDAFVNGFRETESRSPAMLDWETGSDLAGFFPGCAVFPPVDRGVDALPYVDRSIDVVAVPWGDSARRSEARRVASAAVIEIAMPGVVAPGFRIVIERLGRHATAASDMAAASRLGLITPAPSP